MTHKIDSIDSDYYSRKLTPQEGAKEYAKLRRDVSDLGILDRDYVHYAFLTIVDIGALLFLMKLVQ